MAHTKGILPALLLVVALGAPAQAQVDAATAATLGGPALTPIGAERAGNADGSIAAWDGGLTEKPAGFEQGERLPNPFPQDKPIYTITAANMAAHAESLSEGHKALLKTYPDTYFMHVFESRRTCNFSQKVYDHARRNAVSGRLVSDGNGIEGALVGAPFPFPQNGLHVFWNHRLSPRPFKFRRWYAMAPVAADGSYELIRKVDDGINHFAGPGRRTEGDVATLADLQNIWVTRREQTTAPGRVSGNIELMRDTVDLATGPRQAWAHTPGPPARVRRVLESGYDTELSFSGGLAAYDQMDMWNGPPDRFDLRLVGKREIITPINNFDLANAAYADLLRPGHINQHHVRYENARAWVVDARLKPGSSHVDARRLAYQNEDAMRWFAIANYDAAGTLARVQEGPLTHWYDIGICYNAMELVYDLRSGQYLANAMTAEEPRITTTSDDVRPERYTPAAMRLGCRSGK